MPPLLKSHPFAVEAHFESSLVLAYAIPKSEIEHLIPECLTLDLFEEKRAFIAVAMVQTKALRPKGLPAFLGSDFFLIGYRVFVRYESNSGRSMRGLYILKSETDKKKMEFLGNTFTHYNYSKIDITRKKINNRIEVESKQSDFKVVVEKDIENVSLPEGSPFKSWKQARKFAGPLPYTFTYDKTSNEVLIIEGVRQNWKPEPVRVVNHHVAFLDTLGIEESVLANAFIVDDIPYHWEKGSIEKWKS